MSGLRVLLAALLILVALTAGAGPARAAGAVGVVVRHSDGRILYAYIPLTSDRMTGLEALQQSGLTLSITAGGAYGTAVCAIDGEGCEAPREDCFCKSYGNPSFFWHYSLRGPDGTWRTANTGAGNRLLHDGDVDGWSWTSGESDLPPVTLAQIATVVRSAGATPTTADAPTAVPTQVAAAASATTGDQPRAAAIAPNGSATPVNAATKPSGTSRGRAIGGFVAVAAVMLALLVLVPLGARRRKEG